MATSPRSTTPARTSTRKRAAKQLAQGNTNARSRRNGTRRSSQTTITELEGIIRNLESQIARLTSGSEIRSTMSGAADQVTKMVSNASHNVGDMVADTLTDVADRFRTSAGSVTTAARAGTGAMQKIGSELERRPLMTVAIALGIGFLAGLVGRRDTA